MKKIFYAAALILVAACSGGQKETRESDGQNAPGKDASAGETKKEVYVINYTTTDKQPVALTKPDGFGDAKILKNEYFADKDSGAIVLDSEPKAIEAGTFAGNTTLKSIEIPKYVMRIEPFAFKECNALAEVKFESRFFVAADSSPVETGTYGVVYRESFDRTIMPNAFFGCRNLSAVSKNASFMSKAYSFNGCFGLPATTLYNEVYGHDVLDETSDLPKVRERNTLTLTVADKGMVTVKMGESPAALWNCKDGVFEAGNDSCVAAQPVNFGKMLDDFIWNRQGLEEYPEVVERDASQILGNKANALKNELKPYENLLRDGVQLPKFETDLVNAKIAEIKENLNALSAVEGQMGAAVTAPRGICLSIVYEPLKDYDTYLGVSEAVFAAIIDVYGNAAVRFFGKDYKSCNYAQKVFVENVCSIHVATYDEEFPGIARVVPTPPAKAMKNIHDKIVILDEQDAELVSEQDIVVKDKPQAAEVVEVEDEAEEEVLLFAEEMPEFPGGAKALNDYLSSNIKYPKISRNMGSQGRVFLRFVVKKDGSVSGVEVLKSSGDKFLDDEALRVVRSMPKWNPGRQDGKAVNVKYTLPVNFRLQ